MSRTANTGEEPRGARVSALAVSSLVFSLVCCIPGSGLVGTILGGAGLIRIGRSDGRLSGRALAFIGLALGLLTTILWLAFGVGTRQIAARYDTLWARPAAAALGALQKGDPTALRALLDP